MSIKLRIKNTKPYKEISPELNGKKMNVIFGCKVYETNELPAVRKTFQELASNTELELVLAKLQKLEKEGDKADESFYTEREELRGLVEELSTSNEDALLDFYKEQVIFIKHASLEIDNDGVNKDLSVADTRTAKPVESLWETPNECLVVLLDAYLSVPSLRGSLVNRIADTILNVNTDEKVKNSK